MEQGKLKRQMTWLDLTFAGLGAIIGSGWLFGSMYGANYAGPSAILAWVIGAVAVMLIGLVYAELGSALPRAGGVIRYPEFSHGPLVGYIAGFATLLAYSTVAGIETEAFRGYAQSWLPFLGTAGGGTTVWGWLVQVAFLCVFFLLNYWSVNLFAKVNSFVTAIKFIVPTLTMIVLLTQIKFVNFSAHGFFSYGFHGVESAVPAAGIIFAFLGFRQPVDFAGEARNPQKDVPLAIITAISVAAVLYILLQIAYVGAIPTAHIAGGWATIKFKSPYADVATLLGLGWLAALLFGDAVLSPSGTGNIYLSSTARAILAWANTKTFFKVFRHVDARTGVPRAALWLSLLLAIFWTLPFPTWGKLVGVTSSATVMTYITGPVSGITLRRLKPDLARPFVLGGIKVIAPIAFVIAGLIIYWSGWSVDWLLIALTLAAWIVYLLAQKSMPQHVAMRDQIKGSYWLISFYVFMGIMSYLGTFGGIKAIPGPWDQLIVIVGAVIAFYWGVASGIDYKIEEDETETAVVTGQATMQA